MRHPLNHRWLVIGLIAAALSMSAAANAGKATLSPSDRKIYREAFELVAEDRWLDAKRLAATARDKLPAKIIHWTYLRYSRGMPGYFQITDFIEKNPNWPHMRRLRSRAELSASHSASDTYILQWTKRHEPVTGRGRIRLGEALIARGKKKQGQAWIRRAWHESRLPRGKSLGYYKTHKSLLTTADHLRRIDNLLWRRRVSEAREVLELLDGGDKAAIEARLAMRKRAKDAEALVTALPSSRLTGTGITYDRVRWLRRTGRRDDALDLLNKPLKALGPAPHYWWVERRIHARYAINLRLYDKAYNILRQHRQTKGSRGYAEAEWLMGWIALRFKNEPLLALKHFNDFAEAVETPVSLARAAYWTARAAAAADMPTLASKWHQTAASYPTTFYGQMSHVAIGAAGRWSVGRGVTVSATERQDFDARELVRAVRYLIQIGENKRADAFLYQLTALAKTPVDRRLVSDLSVEAGRPQLSVRITKAARRVHVPLGLAGYPTVSLPNDLVEPALAYAVIRQESEFRTEAVSPAGARGLMQLMPGTARQVAKGLGLKYRRSKLMDPEFNMTMGTNYLAQMLEKYNGSYIMAVAAYNAGDHRVDRWMDRYGDPRLPNVDAIDWIEKIPFEETRNYVQRVMENLQIYRTVTQRKRSKLALASDLKRGK